jgi:hypothetical protein
MKTWKIIGAAVVTLTIIALGYLPFGSAEEGKNVEQMITEAKTPADHRAAATFSHTQSSE